MQERNIDELIERHATALQAYQNRRYAAQYLEFIAKVRAREQALSTGSEVLTRAAASSLFKLMSYKDEYEVARLHSRQSLMSRLSNEFEGEFRLRFHLAPPGLSRFAREPQKRELGAWLLPVFSVLSRLRFLRGTPFDVFGYSSERRIERELIGRYRETVTKVLGCLDRQHLEEARHLLSLPQQIRGFGHIKVAAAERVRAEEERLLRRFTSPEGQGLDSSSSA